MRLLHLIVAPFPPFPHVPQPYVRRVYMPYWRFPLPFTFICVARLRFTFRLVPDPLRLHFTFTVTLWLYVADFDPLPILPAHGGCYSSPHLLIGRLRYGRCSSPIYLPTPSFTVATRSRLPVDLTAGAVTRVYRLVTLRYVGGF